MRGRKPKPAELRELQGNAGKRAIPATPKARPLSRVPETPGHLSDEAKAEWNRVAPELIAMGCLTGADRAALAAYCDAWAAYVDASEKIQKTSPIVRTPNGSLQQSPYVGIKHRSMELMAKFMTEFGMSPSSRIRLGRPTGDAGAGAGGAAQGDALDQYLDSDPDAQAIH